MSTEVEHSEPIGTPGRPRFWIPEQDASAPRALTLRVLTYTSRTTAFGDNAVVVGEEPGTGQVWSRMLTGAVLRNEFSRQRPMPDELVRMEYCGTATVQHGTYAGREYASWSVETLRGPEVPDWELLGQPEPEVKLVRGDHMTELPRRVDADVEIDDADLPWAAEERSIQERAREHFGDEPPE